MYLIPGAHPRYAAASLTFPVAEVVRLLAPNSHEFGYGSSWLAAVWRVKLLSGFLARLNTNRADLLRDLTAAALRTLGFLALVVLGKAPLNRETLPAFVASKFVLRHSNPPFDFTQNGQTVLS